MKRVRKVLRGRWFGKAEPYPHLSDAELDTVISDWLDGGRPSEEEAAADALAAMVATLADSMDLNRRRAA